MNTKLVLLVTFVATLNSFCLTANDDRTPTLKRKNSSNIPSLPVGVAAREKKVGTNKIISYHYREHAFSITVDKSIEASEAYLDAYNKHFPCRCGSKNPLIKLADSIKRASLTLSEKRRSLYRKS